MRMMRKVLLLSLAGLVAAAVLVFSASAASGPTHPLVVPSAGQSLAQPPAWIAIAPATPTRPAIAGSGNVWVQPPAWIPIVATTPGQPATIGAVHVWVQPSAWIPTAA